MYFQCTNGASENSSLSDLSKSCINAGEQERELEKDGDCWQYEGNLLISKEHTLVETEEFLPAIKSTMSSGEEQTEPA